MGRRAGRYRPRSASGLLLFMEAAWYASINGGGGPCSPGLKSHRAGRPGDEQAGSDPAREEPPRRVGSHLHGLWIRA